MKKRICVVIAGAAFLISGASIAADLSNLVGGDFDVRSGAVRKHLAQMLSKDVKALSDLLPTPRPAERAWLDEEQRAITKLAGDAQSSRRFQLYHSPEFQHAKLYDHLREIQSALTCAMDDQDLRRHFYCWAVAALHLGDRYLFVDGVNILQSAKRLPDDLVKRGGVGSLEGFAIRYELYARGIQEHLVLRYLRGDLLSQ